MSNKYSDIIKLSNHRSVYNIQEEGPKDWESFIANDQFNSILRDVVSSVSNNDQELHKSFWISGTYGSGKSHAGSVIKHLLCDDVKDIEWYVNKEYSDSKYLKLRENLLQMRTEKRFFPANFYGQEKISNILDLSLQIQRGIKKALDQAGIHLNIKTDYDTYVNHIELKPDFWRILIDQDDKLRAVAPDIEKLKKDLKASDAGVLERVNDALRASRLDVRMENANLPSWIIDVQNELRKQTDYNGLLLVWDEFTNVATSSVGKNVFEELQQVNEVFMSEANDSYFLLISHPSALSSLSTGEKNFTIDRYNYFTYNMEPVSAFKIMSRKFDIVNGVEHKQLVDAFYEDHQELPTIYSKLSNDPEQTRDDILALFPLHPGTANLATHYAREAGSSSRSVFEFLACDAVRGFFEDKDKFTAHETITADYLWDYVYKVFDEDPTRFGMVTQRYKSYYTMLTVEQLVVFKSVLLLNALNNIGSSDSTVPSLENIKNLFVGTPLFEKIDEILNFFNDKSIIQRLPGDIFSIQFAALPADEIESNKKSLISSSYKYTELVAKYGNVISEELTKNYANIARPFHIDIFSQESNATTLVNAIERGHKKRQGYELYIAFLVSKDYNELNFLKQNIKSYSEEGYFKNMVVVISDGSLGPQNYNSFINILATAECAQSHHLNDQYETYSTNASKLLKEWAIKIKNAQFSYFINGETDSNAGSNLVQTMNSVVAPKIFTSGPESLTLIQVNYSKTYWKKQLAKKIVDAMLQFQTKKEVIDQAGGQGKHVEFLLQDSVDDNLKLRSDIDPEHPLKKVCNYIDSVFSRISKNQEFNLAEKLEKLTEPPFGLYQSYAGMAMVAYAMRKRINKIFDTNGKPRDARNLVDDVVNLFKTWEDGKNASKLNFMFESKEASELCEHLINVFKLRQLKSYKDIGSLTDARWAVLAYCTEKGYPLWSLKNTGCSSNLVKLTDNIGKICDPNGNANQELVSETAQLLKDVELDYSNLLAEENVFQRGFLAFLKQDSSVNLKDEEFEDLYEYLQKHLQGEIGRWSETEVLTEEMHWRMEKQLPPTPPQPPVDPNPGPNPPVDIPGGDVINGPTIIEKRSKASEIVKNCDEAQVRDHSKNSLIT